MRGALYLLVKEDKTSFKIGITNNIEARYLRLSSIWGEIDLDSSCTISGSRHEVSGLERTLHYLLDNWRIAHQDKAEGYSEWFSMDCFDKAVEFIHSVIPLKRGSLDNKITYGIKIDKEIKRSSQEFTKHFVVLYDSIIDAYYKSSVSGQRLIKILVSMVDDADIKFNPYTLHIADFAALVGIDSKDCLESVKVFTKTILSQPFALMDDKSVVTINWFSSVLYISNNDLIKFNIDPSMRYYLSQLREYFDKHELGMS